MYSGLSWFLSWLEQLLAIQLNVDLHDPTDISHVWGGHLPSNSNSTNTLELDYQLFSELAIPSLTLIMGRVTVAVAMFECPYRFGIYGSWFPGIFSKVANLFPSIVTGSVITTVV